MTNEEKFYRYFFNEMSAKEKQDLEVELNSSEELRNDFEGYKKVIDLVNKSKDVRLDAQYTQTILSEFRRKLEAKRKKSAYLKYGYAFALLFIAVLGYSVITKMIDEKPDLQKTYSNLTDEEASYLANEMDMSLENDFDESTIAKIDSLYTNKLTENINESIDDNNFQSVSKDINLNEIDKYLTENDVETIFAELSNKEILKR